MTRALKDLAAHTRFPVVFGGYVHDGSVRVSTVLGNRTRSLEGLVVKPERGLGGRAITELRPRMTPDYRSSRQITHDYDGHVLGEGLSTLLAVPIVVGGAVRGVLYGGAWAESSVGDVVAAPAFRVAQEVATELRIRDEVERRVAALRPVTGAVTVTAPSESTTDAAQREELRASYAELRSIVASVDDAGLRARLSAIEERLAGLTGGGIRTGRAAGHPPVAARTRRARVRRARIHECRNRGDARCARRDGEILFADGYGKTRRLDASRRRHKSASRGNSPLKVLREWKSAYCLLHDPQNCASARR